MDCDPLTQKWRKNVGAAPGFPAGAKVRVAPGVSTESTSNVPPGTSDRVTSSSFCRKVTCPLP